MRTVQDFDPFLMLDSFDSDNPEDYIKGFPLHPHRGIETITYLIQGEIEHQDSLGNSGVIRSGESQWMTAGSGILHQEMPQAAPRMLGLQIWLNLPKKSKMTHPAYFDITAKMIPEINEKFGTVRIVSGEYAEKKGVNPPHIPATMLDITLNADRELLLPVNPDETVFVFLIEGDAIVGGLPQDEKTAVLFDAGDAIRIRATETAPSRFMFFSGKPLHEPVAWGGPIVMNTREELESAFDELNDGTFIRHNAKE
ncbi:pirin family protein [Brucepastera parasyntrophica]|uniref:pirin family protein n=1 Tax=Brucepastera parasyntrophica TaxID=2880008 RepID=UPI0021087CAC|nr:pirin family protein [Brucepastera parasyntrophica]ULQ59908.1 pirin family protein [Brucepastera parasyntrophica]